MFVRAHAITYAATLTGTQAYQNINKHISEYKTVIRPNKHATKTYT